MARPVPPAGAGTRAFSNPTASGLLLLTLKPLKRFKPFKPSLPESILALGLFFLQAADAGVGSAAVGYGDGEEDLVGAG